MNVAKAHVYLRRMKKNVQRFNTRTYELCVSLQWYSNLNVSFIRFWVLSVLLQPKKTLVGFNTAEREKYFDIYVHRQQRNRNDLNAISIECDLLRLRNCHFKWIICRTKRRSWNGVEYIKRNDLYTVIEIRRFDSLLMMRVVREAETYKKNLECKIMRHNILRHFECYITKCSNAKQLV